MAEYIERSVAIARTVRMECEADCPGIDFAELRKMLAEIPAADVAPVVHGRWETDREDIEWGNYIKRKFCTNCGKRPHFDKEKRKFILTDYCHNCGARMDGEA